MGETKARRAGRRLIHHYRARDKTLSRSSGSSIKGELTVGIDQAIHNRFHHKLGSALGSKLARCIDNMGFHRFQ